MNDKVIFHRPNGELEYRTACSILPAGSIPVAMVVNSTVVVLGSPDYLHSQIVEFAEQVTGYSVDPMFLPEINSGRGNFFDLAIRITHGT